MKFQRNKIRGFSSALYWLLILGVVASYFALIAERDPAPSASVSMDRVTADALADTETGREDYDRPRVDALRAFPPHTKSYNSGDSAPLEGRRAVRSGSGQTAIRRDSAPQPADLASSDSDAGGPADEELSADASLVGDPAQPEDKSQTASAPDALGQSDKGGDRNAGAGDTEANDQIDPDEDGNSEYYVISGQVVDEGGRPISRIGVVAVARRLFDEAIEPGFGDFELEKSTATEATGFFHFGGLANGEYEIRTVASDYYPKIASMTVRAGVTNAKLVITDEREVLIDGYVANPEGRPLGGVEVYASSMAEPVAISGANGFFNFPMTVRGDRGSLLTLLAEGYQDQKVNLTRNDWHGLPQVEIDVVMQPAQQLTTVSGVVRSKAGDPVVGEQVYLKGASAKYKGVTDATGRFSVDQVAVGGNYALWIMPKGPYEKHRQDRLTVPAGGLNNLDIVLEPLGFGTVMGRMFDIDGNAVPGFTLFARSDSARGASVQVTSDGGGYFVAEDVPEGRLRIESGSFPRFVVSGIQLPEGGEVDVDVVLDVGSKQVTGRVTDDLGRPLAGADITLSWVLRENSLVHESLRKTTSGADGGFEFTKVGGGTYRIIARAPGFEVAQLDEDIGGGYGGGGNVDLQLVPLAE